MKVADFDMDTDNIVFNKQPITWHGSTPPMDRIIHENRKVQPNKVIQSLLIVLASLGLVLAFIFLAVNIKYASHRYVDMNLNVWVYTLTVQMFAILTCSVVEPKISLILSLQSQNLCTLHQNE